MTAVLAVLMAGQVADLIFAITGPLSVTLSLQNTQLKIKMYYVYLLHTTTVYYVY